MLPRKFLKFNSQDRQEELFPAVSRMNLVPNESTYCAVCGLVSALDQ